MKALKLVEPFNIKLIDTPIPEPKVGEALVRVQAVSLCGTDIHAYHGQQALFDYPRIPGHEVCGIVEAVSEDNSEIAVGDSVIAIPYIHCGTCIACRKGKIGCCENLKVIGVHREGALAEYFTIPIQNLIKVPADMDIRKASMIEPFAISAHAVHNVNVKENENVLVIGVGPIGLGAAAIARTYGARVILADTLPERLEFAKTQFGFTESLNPFAVDYGENLKMLTNGDGPDTIIDCTGNGKSMSKVFNYLSFGGKVVFVGIFNGELNINAVEFHKRQTELYGSRAAKRCDFEYVIQCMNEGKIDPGKFITHEIAFDENIIKNFKELMDLGGSVFKAIVRMEA